MAATGMLLPNDHHLGLVRNPGLTASDTGSFASLKSLQSVSVGQVPGVVTDCQLRFNSLLSAPVSGLLLCRPFSLVAKRS